MKQYSQMKDSGIEWIGEIPVNWTIQKIKHLVLSHKKVTYGIVQPGIFSENGILLIRGRDYISGWGTKGDFFKVEKKLHQQYIRAKVIPGDVLMCIVGATTGAVNQVPDWIKEANITQTTARISCDSSKITSQFMLYILDSIHGKTQVANYAKGAAQPGLNLSMVENFIVCIPKLKEQKQITNYLNNKTKKIDCEIEKNQKLILLLKEQRQSTINHAVIKGLDDSVSMKDSGIEWIGEIPEHWNVRKIRHILIPGKSGIKIGPFGSSLKLDSMVKTGYKVYGQENVIEQDFEKGERFIDQKKFDEMIGHEIIPNDIIVTMMGTTGLSQVVPPKIQRGIMDSHLVRIRSDNLVCDTSFLSLLINSSDYVKFQLKLESKGSIMEGLNSSILKSVKIFLPKLNEQKLIVSYLEKQTSKIDSLISKVELQIKQLQEFRESLISSAVTGKIRVSQA